MENKSTWKWIVASAIILGTIWLLFSIFKSNDEWTLLVCKTKLNESECQDISYTIPGFESAKECLLEGTTRFKEDGFECGSNCEVTELGLQVCSEICNASGCN